MIPANLHELQGIVKLRKGPIPIGENNFKKWYLYVDCPYLERGKIANQTIKAICFSRADDASQVSSVIPGDEVKFSFRITGKINESKLDFCGMPSCWNEIIIAGQVDILNTSQRQLYNTGEKDDLGVFDTNPKFKYKDSDAQLEADTSDLPF